jgi:hypothetical protein
MRRIATPENEAGPVVLNRIALKLRNASPSRTHKQTHNFQNICLLSVTPFSQRCKASGFVPGNYFSHGKQIAISVDREATQLAGRRMFIAGL